MCPKFRLAFGVVLAAQVILLLGLIGDKEYILRTGTDVVLQTIPVDPRSLLQGDIAILDYEVARLRSGTSYPEGVTWYVTLVEGEEVWVAEDYSTKRPSADNVFIKGTVERNGILDFGIGTYFVPEGTGHIIEGAVDIKVVVSVSGSGRSVIQEVLVDGESFDPSLRSD